MPIIQKVKQDTLLTNIAVSYNPEGYIADQVLPPVPVKLEDGSFWVYDKSRFYTPDSLRAPRSAYKRLDWSATTDTYHAEEYGLESLIDRTDRPGALVGGEDARGGSGTRRGARGGPGACRAGGTGRPRG